MPAPSQQIAIIDYGAGNVRSVANALERIQASYFITADPEEIRRAVKVILPGVGEARSAMDSLYRDDLISLLRGLKKPFLGICLGMQLLYDHSTERATDCLGLINGQITRFDAAILKVPHMGWNQTVLDTEIPLFAGCRSEEFLYYVHSYFAPVSSSTIATCEYGISFAAAVRHDNFFGVQFHPEKSADAGSRILNNFVNLC